MPMPLADVLAGFNAGWSACDLFHFDAQLRISGKFTYASSDRPQLRRDGA